MALKPTLTNCRRNGRKMLKIITDDPKYGWREIYTQDSIRMNHCLLPGPFEYCVWLSESIEGFGATWLLPPGSDVRIEKVVSDDTKGLF